MTTAELAPIVMTKLKETLERHSLELKKDKCTAHFPVLERVENIREEMTQFLKWTTEGFVMLGTANEGEYRTEITTEARKSHEPTNSRLRNARMLADRIQQMCDIVSNNTLSFDCCVVPPEALASYAQQLDRRWPSWRNIWQLLPV